MVVEISEIFKVCFKLFLIRVLFALILALYVVALLYLAIDLFVLSVPISLSSNDEAFVAVTITIYTSAISIHLSLRPIANMASTPKYLAPSDSTCFAILNLTNILFILGIHTLNEWVIEQYRAYLEWLFLIRVGQRELLVNYQLLYIERPKLNVFGLSLISYFFIRVYQKVMAVDNFLEFFDGVFFRYRESNFLIFFF